MQQSTTLVKDVVQRFKTFCFVVEFITMESVINGSVTIAETL